jgi:hypothetical protein
MFGLRYLPSSIRYSRLSIASTIPLRRHPRRHKNITCEKWPRGNWVFPRLKNNSVNILEDAVVDLAQKTFECDFVQACNWG